MMIRQLFRVFFLLVAIGSIGYGGYYVYQKQAMIINHNVFNHLAESQSIHFTNPQTQGQSPNLVAAIEVFDIPEAGHDLLVPLLNSSHANGASSIEIAFDSTAYVISMKGLSNKAFNAVFGVEPKKEGQLAIDAHQVYSKQIQGFTVLSNQPVKINQAAPATSFEGNADFFYTVNDHRNAYKVKPNYTFYSNLSSVNLKGQPVNPYELITNCPLAATTIQFYGSSRFKDDANALFSSNNVDFFDWVDHAVALVKKDSFEILMGVQNEYADLKNRLEEVTLNASEDSLLPPKIYLNNFEIMPFRDTVNWQAVCPELSGDLNYFSAYDNTVILTNSLPAMYWLLREIQLGNTYNHEVLSKRITSELNILEIQKNEMSPVFNMVSKLKDGLGIRLNARLSSEAKGQRTTDSQSFSYFKSINQIKSISRNGERTLLFIGQNFLEMVGGDGKTIWERQFEQKINASSIERIKGTDVIALIEGRKLHIIDMDGEILPGFPFTSAAVIQQLKIVNYDAENTRVLINTEGTILNVNLQGKLVEGWTKPKHIGQLNEAIHYNAVNDFDFIFFTTPKDSLVVLNRRGERRFKRVFKRQLKHPADFISGKANMASARLLGFENNHIYTQYLETGFVDSTALGQRVDVDEVHWLKLKNKPMLCLESFDRLMLFNEFGILELEIIKPVNNAKLINISSIQEGVFIFFNIQTNKVYLLDEYGNLKRRTSLAGTNILDYHSDHMVTLVDKKVIVHKL